MATTQTVLSPATGATVFVETALGNSALTVKGSSGTVYGFDLDNTANAAVSYVKAYYTNGAVTVGTTVPDEVIAVPASVRIVVVPATNGKAFSSGLQVAALTVGGTTGTTAPTSAFIARVVYA